MRFREVKKLINEQNLQEDQDLFEINMSPSNLKAEAAKTGAMAGMEFEMIVPNTESGDEDMEPDYDEDQRVRDIDEAVNFFDDGDWNGRAEIRRLREQMEEAYFEWKMDHLAELWDREGFAYFSEYLDREDPFDEDEAEEEARNELQAQYGDDITPEEFQTMLEAILDERRSAYYQEQWDDQGRNYAYAQEEFNDERSDDVSESDWLHDENIRYASDVENNYNITWPYWRSGGDGGASIERVADDFSGAVGMRVNWSSNYHGGRREPNAYVVEPDGSLDPDDGNDSGLEFVSPPMPIDKMIEQLNKVKEWAGNYGCYTNQSTGLHINISVPNYDLSKLDYVKLALLLGDKYILDQYGRSSNTYAKSALGKVQELIKRSPDKGKELLDKMRGHMDALATKAIHTGSTDKYTSINTKSGYIEFRSPGGDWLDANFDKIENTLMRFTVALSAAMNPEAYREEYLKKLYKLLEPVAIEQNNDTVKYFADYVAGKTPKAALRSFVKQAQLARKIKRGETGGEQFWWRVSNPQHSHGEIEVVASSKQEAIEKALAPDGYPSWANTKQSIEAVPVRPYDTSPLKARAGEPQAIGQSSGATLNGRPSNPDGGWVIVPENDRQTVVYRFAAAGYDDATIVRRQWAQAHPERVWIVQRDDNQTLGQPTSGSPNSLSQTDAERRMGLPDQTGDANYEIVDRRTGRRVFVMIANTEYDARRKYADWLSAAGYPIETEDFGFREIALPGSTLDLQRQRAAAAQQQQGNWGIWIDGASRFSRAPGQPDENVLRRFPSREAAEQWLEQHRVENPRMRTDIEVREIEPVQSAVPDEFRSTENVPREGQPRNLVPTGPGPWEIYRISNGESIRPLDHTNRAAAEEEARSALGIRGEAPELYGVRTRQQATGGTFTGEWKVVDPNGQEIYRFSGVGNSQSDANNVAIRWLRDNPRYMQDGVEVLPVMS